jgi:hypothetical protein
MAVVPGLSVQYVDEQLPGRQHRCFNSVKMTFFLLFASSIPLAAVYAAGELHHSRRGDC